LAIAVHGLARLGGFHGRIARIELSSGDSRYHEHDPAWVLEGPPTCGSELNLGWIMESGQVRVHRDGHAVGGCSWGVSPTFRASIPQQNHSLSRWGSRIIRAPAASLQADKGDQLAGRWRRRHPAGCRLLSRARARWHDFGDTPKGLIRKEGRRTP
jgi:hypothetical protein